MRLFLLLLLLLALVTGAVSCSVWKELGQKPDALRLAEFQSSPHFSTAQQIFLNSTPDKRPAGPLPESRPVDLQQFLAPTDSIRFIWLGHSSLLVNVQNHIVLLDLRGIGMTGKVADLLVSDVHITANKNTVPFDPQSPFVTSGLRLGTAACTTRGFDEDAFREVADVIADRLLNPEDSAIEERCRERVAALCERFPLYAHQRELQPA